MKLRVKLRAALEEPVMAFDVPLFSILLASRRRRWSSLLVSASCHIAAVYLSLTYADFIRETTTAAIPPHTRVLELRLTFPYEPKRPLIEPAPLRLGARQTHGAQPGKGGGAGKSGPVLRTRHDIPRGPETIIQLDSPPVIQQQPALKMPVFIVVAPAPPPRKKVVLPAPAQRPPAEVPSIADVAPPLLGPGVNDLHLTPAFSLQRPALSVLPPGAAPVVVPEAPVSLTRTLSTASHSQGFDNLNVAILPARPTPPASSVIVRPGSQIGPTGGGSPTKGSGGSGDSSQVAGSAGRGSGKGEGTAESGGGSLLGALGGPAGAIDGSAHGTLGGPGPVTGGGSPGPAPPVVINHPRDGSYEVVVVQSGTVIPGSSGLLAGRPVYTVYLRVGLIKEWILQYCPVSTEDSATQTGPLVRLGNPAPLTAPFAFLILRPSIVFKPGVPYTFIHGFVDPSGHFENLTEVGPSAIDDPDRLLRTLRLWEFRPATRDGVPTAVEILLCIPNLKA